MGVFDDVVDDVIDDSTETDTEDQGENTPDNEGQDGEEPKETDAEPGKAKPEDGEGDQEGKKPKNKLQERFDEITQHRRAAEARAERAERELAELRRAKQSPQMPEKPDAKNFNNLHDFNIAVAKYNTAVEYIQRHEQETAERTQADRERALQAKISSEMGKFKDFADNVRNINDVELNSDVLFDFVMNDPNGVAVLNELGKNRADAIFLSTKSAVEQARLLGKASARIAAQGSGKKVSGAPKPASKVGGGTGSPAPKNLAKMSGDEYIKHRQAMEKKT